MKIPMFSKLAWTILVETLTHPFLTSIITVKDGATTIERLPRSH